jgi:ABC-type iron transport system FetAB ATPase subunit
VVLTVIKGNGESIKFAKPLKVENLGQKCKYNKQYSNLFSAFIENLLLCSTMHHTHRFVKKKLLAVFSVLESH